MAYNPETDLMRQAYRSKINEMYLSVNFIKELFEGLNPEKCCVYYIYLLNKYGSFQRMGEFIQSFRNFANPDKEFNNQMENDQEYQEYLKANPSILNLLTGK